MAQPRLRTFVTSLVIAVLVYGPVTAVGVWLIWAGIDPARAYLGGTPGQVTVSHCRWEDEKPRGWDCRGTFNGQGVAIPEVRIRYLLDAEPVNPVDTIVSGPESTTAWTPGATLLGQIVAGLFIAAIAPSFGLYYWRRDRRARAAERASSAERSGKGRDKRSRICVRNSVTSEPTSEADSERREPGKRETARASWQLPPHASAPTLSTSRGRAGAPTGRAR